MNTVRLNMRSLPALIVGLARKRYSVALLDQCVVSGTSFVTSVVVGRYGGATELGRYALAFTILVMLTTVHESLVTTPYTVRQSRFRGRARRRFAGAMLVQHLLLTLGAMLVAMGLAVAALLVARPSVAVVVAMLTLVIPFTLLREFARRTAYAHLRSGQALLVNGVVAAIQLGGLALLVSGDWVSPAAAYAAMGVGCMVAGVGWLVGRRRQFLLRGSGWRAEFWTNWRFSRWILASRGIGIVHSYSLHWLLAVRAATAATGIYAACATVVLFANPFMYAIANLLGPHAAVAFTERGLPGVRREVVQSMGILVGGTTAMACAWFLLGEWIIALLYGGGEYAGHRWTITVLAINTICSAFYLAINSGLLAIERSDVNFRTGIAGLATTLLLAFPLIAAWGILGGAIAALVGSALSTGMQAWIFFRLVGKEAA